jgi:putative DNA primase/helicase
MDNTVTDNPFNVIDITEVSRKPEKHTYMTNHISKQTITNIPNELKINNNWLWSNENKEPVNNAGFNVNGYDLKNTVEFNEMITNNPKKFYYNYSLQNDFIVIDLDKCFKKTENNIGKELHEFAKDIINKVKDLNPYIEYSLSGQGLHIILKSTKAWVNSPSLKIKLKKTHKKFENILDDKSGIEIFNNKHCITLTGHTYLNYSPNTLGTANKTVRDLYKSLKEIEKNNYKKTVENNEKKLNNKTTDMKDIFEFIKVNVSIEELLDKYQVEMSNGNIVCPLPGHTDKTPSFHVYTTDNQWYCFGCNKGKSIIDFVMLMDNITNIQACVKIDKMFNLKLDFDAHNKNTDKTWIIAGEDGKYYIDITVLRDHIATKHNIYFTEQSTYLYKDGCYKTIESYEIKLLIESHMPTTYNNKFKKSTYVDECYNQLKRTTKHFNDFNKNGYIANFKNCNVEFKLGSDEIVINEHSPNNLFTYQTSTNFENKTCNTWVKFIEETLPPDQIILLQEMMGYALLNNNRAKKFFAFYGRGDTGKSVILTTLVNIISKEYTSTVPLQVLASKNNRFDTSSLVNKLINVCGDLPSTPIEDSSIIKQLTGNDYMRSEKKGKDAIEFMNTARLYFSMNQLPSLCDKSLEFFSRFIIIPFNNQVKKEDIDEELPSKFDLDGVTAWCVEGLKRLVKNHLKFSITKTNEELIKYYIQKDSPIVDFIETCCSVTGEKTDVITQAELLNTFKYYCKHIINNDYASKIKVINLVEGITTRYGNIKYSKNIKSNDKNVRGLRGVKLSEEFFQEFNKYSTNNF